MHHLAVDPAAIGVGLPASQLFQTGAKSLVLVHFPLEVYSTAVGMKRTDRLPGRFPLIPHWWVQCRLEYAGTKNHRLSEQYMPTNERSCLLCCPRKGC